MKCPHCGASRLVPGARDMAYAYKGESTTLPSVTGDFCPFCDESILDAAESRRTIRQMLSFNKQGNANVDLGLPGA